MSKTIKHNGGPKTSPSLVAIQLIMALPQGDGLTPMSSFFLTKHLRNIMVNFDPQTLFEKVLIFKLTDYSVRLMCIHKVENAMFDLTKSEAVHPEKSIKPR